MDRETEINNNNNNNFIFLLRNQSAVGMYMYV